MSLTNYSREVVNDYEKLLKNDKGYDVIIYAGENEDAEELHAYSNILRIRSQYFCAALSDEWAKKKDGKFILEKPNISPSIFRIILRFIYCGKINFTRLKVIEILKLSIAVDELNIQPLIPCIEEHLIKHKSLQRYLIETLDTIYQQTCYTNLLEFCLYKICADPEDFINSGKFIIIKPPLLEFLLKRDDFGLKEIVIWDSLLNWAFAQNPTIQKDVTGLSKEEITTIERTLHRYIPLVRFYCISPEDFHDKIYPLKKLLPKDLVNNLLTFYLVPNRKTNIDKQSPRRSKYRYDSVIAEFQHFALFCNWIDKKNDLYNDLKEIPHKFNLVYRASRDGDTTKTFHEKTDNKPAHTDCVFVAKIKDTNQIIGGYSPVNWSESGPKKSAGSFIFSFKDCRNINTRKIGRVINPEYAICCSKDYGPVFGNFSDECGGDIMLRPDGKWSSHPSSYPDINIPRDFEVEDYEVFTFANSSNFFQRILAMR